MPELTPQAFSERWAKSTLSEKASAQSHFIDLCRVLGKPTPAEADPKGDFYTFERGTWEYLGLYRVQGITDGGQAALERSKIRGRPTRDVIRLEEDI